MRRNRHAIKRLRLPESDLRKLKSVVTTARAYLSSRSYIEKLEERLEDAEIVAPQKVPSDLVEIGTSVRVTDLDRSEQNIYKLVFPKDANYEDHVSVIAPLGSALLGARIGEVVEVDAPARRRRIRVDDIVTHAKMAA